MNKYEQYIDDVDLNRRVYPGFRLNKRQEKLYQVSQSYFSDDIDKQVFYNITDDNTVPYGSTYSYTIPSILQDADVSKSSDAYKQKHRRRREHFNEGSDGSDCDIVMIVVVMGMLIGIVLWF